MREAALAILTLLLSLGLAELTLRLAAPIPLGRSQALHQVVDQSLPGVKPVITYSRDALGLRSATPWTRPKADDTLRVLCLGASTTDQATQGIEDTWCTRIGRSLADQVAGQGLRVEAGGVGRGGWRAVDDLRFVESHLDELEPDLVLTLLGINDLSWNGGPEYRYEGIDQRLAEIRHLDEDREPRDGCAESLQLCARYHLARSRIESWWSGRGNRKLEWHSRKLPERRAERRALPAVDPAVRAPDPIEEFGDALVRLVDGLHDRGILVLVLGQPTLWQPEPSQAIEASLWFPVRTPSGPVRPSGRWLVEEMARYNAVQLRIASERGASHLDLDALVPKSLDDYFDDCHFTDRGSAAVARAITAHLRDRLCVEPLAWRSEDHGCGHTVSTPDRARLAEPAD